jgi:hypothetical protein
MVQLSATRCSCITNLWVSLVSFAAITLCVVDSQRLVFVVSIYFIESRDSSVGIALGYGLEDRGSRVRFPAEAGNLSLHHRVQKGSGAYPASYPIGTRGSFLGGKAAGT